MIKVYAVVLVISIIALFAWIALHVYAQSSDGERFDPETRFGVGGRRVVGGAMAFALAGMSAEFSPRDLSWPIALLLAVIGAGAMVWYVGRPALAGTPDGAETSDAAPRVD